ncbi:hypothetical protein DFH09DRAFT_1394046 [Mycena vulgaris]|nr:hypothetical protein DFH09DRAFT_1394046 [Mycena vulgaris]
MTSSLAINQGTPVVGVGVHDQHVLITLGPSDSSGVLFDIESLPDNVVEVFTELEPCRPLASVLTAGSKGQLKTLIGALMETWPEWYLSSRTSSRPTTLFIMVSPNTVSQLPDSLAISFDLALYLSPRDWSNEQLKRVKQWLRSLKFSVATTMVKIMFMEGCKDAEKLLQDFRSDLEGTLKTVAGAKVPIWMTTEAEARALRKRQMEEISNLPRDVISISTDTDYFALLLKQFWMPEVLLFIWAPPKVSLLRDGVLGSIRKFFPHVLDTFYQRSAPPAVHIALALREQGALPAKSEPRRHPSAAAVRACGKAVGGRKEAQVSVNYRRDGAAIANLVSVVQLFGEHADDPSADAVWLVGFQIDLMV